MSLTVFDREIMRIFSMDPNDQQHAAAFLQAKLDRRYQRHTPPPARVRLDAADLQAMRDRGMDPKSRDDVMAYAREKLPDVMARGHVCAWCGCGGKFERCSSCGAPSAQGDRRPA